MCGILCPNYVHYRNRESFELGGVSIPCWVVSRPCQDPISLKLMAAASILLEQLRGIDSAVYFCTIKSTDRQAS